MRLNSYTDADSFLRDAQPELEKCEAKHNLLFGLALRLHSAPQAKENGPFFATIRDEGGLLVSALMTPHHPLVLSSVRSDVDEAVDLIVEYLTSSGYEISGVIAPNALSERFAQQWSRASGRPARVGMRQRLYRLTEVCDVPTPAGELRSAWDTDLEVVSRWIAAFYLEAVPEDMPEKARATAQQRIDLGEIYLWEYTEPRSIAARTRPTLHGVAINSVYTPPEWRGQGFATACVARLSSQFLKGGYSFCVLYTDLANPTSNSIYTRIGYQPILDFMMHRFERKPA
jgi:uncharacterized protein